jgi:glucosamine kinase
MAQAAPFSPPNPTRPTPGLGLGLDVGGTATRWALCDADGGMLARGQAAGWTALDLAADAGREAVTAVLAGIARNAAPPWAAGPDTAPQRLVAGVTGLDATQRPLLQELLGRAFGLPGAAVTACNDIELVCHGAFAPGRGLVVYAGTGSVAALLDETGTLQRAGGRGVLIDDAGGGHWIACRALRSVWRTEDETPGAWRQSALARALFERLGGPAWALTRAGVYGATRGEVGRLALAVAEAAEDDPRALAQLRAAGVELARLALALRRRCGALPVALAGRVWDLHPVVEAAFRAALPADTPVFRLASPPEDTAARWAAVGAPVPALP